MHMHQFLELLTVHYEYRLLFNLIIKVKLVSVNKVISVA